mgnify:FL=1
MQRFSFLSIILFFFLSCQEKDQERKNKTSKPNIILIVADDLGYGDLSIYGQNNFETPNIDQLAKNGMLFTQFYSGSTVCAPSRSALMTGQHTGHTPIRGNKEVRPEGQQPLPKDTPTLAKALQKEGYVTGAFGKWGLGAPGSEGDPIKQGFDTFYGYNCQRFGHHYYPTHLWHNRDSILIYQNFNKADQIYGPDLIQRETIKFIERYQKQPFFLYVPSIIPHAELIAPELSMSVFRNKFLPEKEFIGVDDGPEFGHGPYRSQKESHAAFAAMISILDQQVGEIVDKISNLGLLDNTLILFTSDNGPHFEGGADPDYFDSNGILKGYKRDLYEGGIRVPLLAQWSGKIEPNSISNHIAAFWDFFPTLTSLFDSNKETYEDGISFLPTLLGQEKQKKHNYLYWEFHEKGGRQAILQTQWKLIKYDVFSKNETKTELYNLKHDSSEENDLANQFPKKVKTLESLLEHARTPSKVFRFNE